MISNSIRILVAVLGAVLLIAVIVAVTFNKGNSDPYGFGDNPVTDPGSASISDELYSDDTDKTNLTEHQSEAAAKEALKAAGQQAAEAEKNLMPNTVDNLLGELSSFGANSAVNDDTYEPSEASSAMNDDISEPSEASSAVNDDVSEPSEASSVENDGGSQPAGYAAYGIIIDAKENPDLSKFTDELAQKVDAALIGEWIGTVDEELTTLPNSPFWSYVFTKNGIYTYINNDGIIETGSYSTKHDPNDINYHSTMVLTNSTGERAVKFYFAGHDPLIMKTDDPEGPIYVKQ